jgi:hypothetical protein
MVNQKHEQMVGEVDSEVGFFGLTSGQLKRLAAAVVIVMGLILFFVPNEILLAIAAVMIMALGSILAMGIVIWIAIGSNRLNLLLDSISWPVALLFFAVTFIASGTLFYHLINSN